MGKPRGKHPEKALSAVRVRTLKQPGRYADGNGLYLIVEPSGAKRWVLRTVVQGRRRDLGLGGLATVSLAEAREKAAGYRKVARTGGDPFADRRKANRSVPTFEAAARAVHKEHTPSWRNPRHAAQWISSLEQYAFPLIGARRVDQVDTPEILRVLGPIWLTKPETARRVKQRIRTVLDWAKAAGHRSGENPADLVAKGLPKQTERADHYAALSYSEVPGFLVRLREQGGAELARLAFELMILTATRTNEVLGARRSEFDTVRQVWTIPGERMKAGAEHRIPLSPRAMEIVQRAFALSTGEKLAFPSMTRPGRGLSLKVFFTALRRMGVETTAHGFRSAFRDWAAERTNFAREVAEAALAHTNKDKVEAAYRRSDLFEKRRQLMNAWAAFVTAAPGKVVPMQARRG